jgi:hypothetical protein
VHPMRVIPPILWVHPMKVIPETRRPTKLDIYFFVLAVFQLYIVVCIWWFCGCSFGQHNRDFNNRNVPLFYFIN